MQWYLEGEERDVPSVRKRTGSQRTWKPVRLGVSPCLASQALHKSKILCFNLDYFLSHTPYFTGEAGFRRFQEINTHLFYWE